MFPSLRSASASLRRDGVRTLLTILSISIAVAAVICVAALGAASAVRVEAQLDSLGDDFVWIEPGSRNLSGVRTGNAGARTLVVEDAFALAAQIPYIRQCSPQVEGREQVISGNQNWNTRYRGVAPSYFDIRRRQLAAGVTFTNDDVALSRRVVVLGPAVATQLFGDDDPIGRTIRMARFPWRVIGVVQSKGSSRGGLDRDDVLFVPYTAASRHLNGKTWIDDILCSVVDANVLDRTEHAVADVLRARHDIPEGGDDDFEIENPRETLELRAQTTRTMGRMLLAIASVSLVVGGVGIMNIMLVSVTERTREIGLRLAIGARIGDIRLQFLVEAAALGLFGGAAGVGLGWLAMELLSAGFGWAMVLSSDAAIAAIGVAAGSGLLFGYYPAHLASGLDPIEALRFES